MVRRDMPNQRRQKHFPLPRAVDNFKHPSFIPIGVCWVYGGILWRIPIFLLFFFFAHTR